MENTVSNMLQAKVVGGVAEALSQDKREGIVIEFVGPPGSGKTTNCLVFHELLSSTKRRVFVFNDVREYFHQLGLPGRIWLYMKTIWLRGKDLLSYTNVLLSNGIRSWDSIFRYLKLCVFSTTLREFMGVKKADIVLLDQWSIQGLWSATIFKPGKFDRLADQLHKYYLNTDMVIYFDVNAETACDRIDSRKWGKSRFDKMSRTERLLQLKKNIGYLKSLFDRSTCATKLKYSTLVSPRKNAEAFVRELNDLHLIQT